MDVNRPLASIIGELEEARAKAHRLVDPLPEAFWGAPPPAGGWSIARCIMHINITAERFLPLITGAIGEARTRGLRSDGPFARDFWGWLLTRWLEPPSRLRVRTPAAFDPPEPAPRAEVMNAFDCLHDELNDCVRSASGYAVDRVHIASPFDDRGRLRYSVYSALRILPAHERRHLWQAERVRTALSG